MTPPPSPLIGCLMSFSSLSCSVSYSCSMTRTCRVVRTKLWFSLTRNSIFSDYVKAFSMNNLFRGSNDRDFGSIWNWVTQSCRVIRLPSVVQTCWTLTASKDFIFVKSISKRHLYSTCCLFFLKIEKPFLILLHQHQMCLHRNTSITAAPKNTLHVCTLIIWIHP